MKSESAAESNPAFPHTHEPQVKEEEYTPQEGDAQLGGSAFNQGGYQGFKTEPAVDDNYGPINVKEDG